MRTQTNNGGAVALTLSDLRERPVLRIEEAGRVLGLSRSAAYAAATRGDLPVIRIGRRLLVPTLALLRLLGDDGRDEAD